jgi:hypothetical protein
VLEVVVLEDTEQPLGLPYPLGRPSQLPLVQGAAVLPTQTVAILYLALLPLRVAGMAVMLMVARMQAALVVAVMATLIKAAHLELRAKAIMVVTVNQTKKPIVQAAVAAVRVVAGIMRQTLVEVEVVARLLL